MKNADWATDRVSRRPEGSEKFWCLRRCPGCANRTNWLLFPRVCRHRLKKRVWFMRPTRQKSSRIKAPPPQSDLSVYSFTSRLIFMPRYMTLRNKLFALFLSSKNFCFFVFFLLLGSFFSLFWLKSWMLWMSCLKGPVPGSAIHLHLIPFSTVLDSSENALILMRDPTQGKFWESCTSKCIGNFPFFV